MPIATRHPKTRPLHILGSLQFHSPDLPDCRNLAENQMTNPGWQKVQLWNPQNAEEQSAPLGLSVWTMKRERSADSEPEAEVRVGLAEMAAASSWLENLCR
jgi:hypothetical protein